MLCVPRRRRASRDSNRNAVEQTTTVGAQCRLNCVQEQQVGLRRSLRPLARAGRGPRLQSRPQNPPAQRPDSPRSSLGQGDVRRRSRTWRSSQNPRATYYTALLHCLVQLTPNFGRRVDSLAVCDPAQERAGPIDAANLAKEGWFKRRATTKKGTRRGAPSRPK